MAEKKRYTVTITEITGDWTGRETVRSYDVITYAFSAKQAESNVRYRTEGAAFRGEAHGTDYSWKAYHYKAIEAMTTKKQGQKPVNNQLSFFR